MSKLMLNTTEAAEMFNLARGTLNNLRSQKKGPRYYKVGKRCLYKPEDILKWIESHPVQTIDSI